MKKEYVYGQKYHNKYKKWMDKVSVCDVKYVCMYKNSQVFCICCYMRDFSRCFTSVLTARASIFLY